MNRSFLNLCLAAASLLMVPSGVVRAELVTLYDDGVGDLPGDQPWVGYFALGGLANQAVHAQGTRLTTDNPASAGYSNHSPLSNPIVTQMINPLFPTLNDNDGYSLSFQLQVFNESHANNDRAGFSVIALGDDGRGIELGFWEDRIFAQTDTPLFTHGEEGLFDTTANETSYVLSIQNNNYSLTAGAQTIVSGALRDYSAFTGTPLGVPYSLRNYLFLGDDTTSASADVALGSIVLNSNLSAVPEPSTFALLGVLAGVCSIRRHRQIRR